MTATTIPMKVSGVKVRYCTAEHEVVPIPQGTLEVTQENRSINTNPIAKTPKPKTISVRLAYFTWHQRLRG